MKFTIVIAALALGLAGCAGSKTKTETTTVTTKTETAVKDAKGGAKAAVKTATDKAAAAVAGAEKVACEHKGDARNLEIRPKDKGCELAYVKGGSETIVATSQNGKAHCTATLEKIKGRLEAAGFSCK